MVEAKLVKQENKLIVLLPKQGYWVLLSTILASSMAFIDTSALNVTLPTLQNDLQASGEQLLWIINAYLLMLAALILIGGSLGDRLGRKKVFMFGISLFIMASLACGLAPNIEFLIGARVVQGIGGAITIPGSLAIITACFQPEERGSAIGKWSAATTIVTLVGPVLGGLLADAGLWRGVFLINLPLGLTTLVILYFQVPESRNEQVSGKIDYPGAILVALGLASLTYGFISLHNFGFQDPRIYGSLSLGVIALVAYIIVQIRSPHPMMPLHLFKSLTFSGTNLLTLFLYGALNVGNLFLSLNLVQAQGYSQSIAGMADMPFALLLSGLSPWAGKLADQYGPRPLLILGPLLAGLGFLIMAFVGLTDGAEDYWTTFFPGITVFGLGMAITVAPLTTTVMGSVPTHYAGTASGINNAVARMAGVLTIAIVGSVALCNYGNKLEVHTASIHLSEAGRILLASQANQLGQTSMLAGVRPENLQAVETAIKLSFADTFGLVMIICTGLAWMSAIAAALMVMPKSK
ncbi:MFS transporter [Calothrix sp. FACHB-1219]|uniref:MFS transporter n=1 Tax=unclassified Calothrix TaxID=2619626 RepID=UPI0016845759|nr:MULTISPECIES: MFS transporter [unclassified Calothrix]MBD2202655.1 MFS transporter [Calothrix sp. FACHB-168]MBD2221716.1 MFS transporter [Calothrix sp. FACHB-1219]